MNDTVMVTAPGLQIARPPCRSIPIKLTTATFASGMNGSLQRISSFDCRRTKLLEQAACVPSWKPHYPKVQTFGLTFPDGVEFLPENSDDKECSDLPRSMNGPQASASGARSKRCFDQPPQKKFTRLKPPDDALSLQDLLFYVLQPPLESLLSGQELVMPFEPFGFQYEGIGWLFSRKSALLADEMGLGKTMQAITALRLLLRSGQVQKTLLVCPKPLIPNWQRELKLWAEELPCVTIEGDAARRRMLWTMPTAAILIANYELMVRDFESFDADDLPTFDLVILDEAQRIKNRESLTAQTCRSIPRKRSWMLTGTPIENRPEEIASLFEFIEIVPPRGTPDLQQLKRLSNTHVLRRTKDLVLTDLPPRLDRDEYLDLAPAQIYAYQVAEKQGIIHLNEMGDSITIQHVFELVLRLKQIANFDPLTGESAKFDRLRTDLEEIVASGSKAILFSQWTRCLDWLNERLKPFRPLVYHGRVPTKKRELILKRFQEDPGSHLLLMSYGVGAVGLNLQCAGYVFLFDRWWNPAVEDQAINRAHRIGQKNPVIVTKFISKNTIEERIDDILREKRDLFAKVLGDGLHSNASLGLNASESFGLFDLKAQQATETRNVGPDQSVVQNVDTID